jgi:hypothetical protein
LFKYIIQNNNYAFIPSKIKSESCLLNIRYINILQFYFFPKLKDFPEIQESSGIDFVIFPRLLGNYYLLAKISSGLTRIDFTVILITLLPDRRLNLLLTIRFPQPFKAKVLTRPWKGIRSSEKGFKRAFLCGSKYWFKTLFDTQTSGVEPVCRTSFSLCLGLKNYKKPVLPRKPSTRDMTSLNQGCHRWQQVKYSIFDIQKCYSFATYYVVFLLKNMANQSKVFRSHLNITYY